MTDYTKASKLMSVLQRQLEVHSDPDQYLVNICNVLINQQQQTLTDIAIPILQQLGQFVILLLIIINIFHISGQHIPDQPTHSSTPDRPTHSSTPDRPTHSSTPDRPTHSSTPDRPTHSSTPDRPTHSSTPDRPTHSSTPDRPTHSSTPDRPTHSSTPDRPTHSSTPDRPTHSSTPDRPTHSSRPDRPTHSSTPDRPTHSSRPDRPTHSSTPDRPTHSSTPDRPTHSSTPDRPTHSSRPDRPTHSSTPDRPTHSSTPDRPTHSSTPDRPTYSSTLTSHIERLNFFQRLFKKIRSRSTSNPSLRTLDPNDQSSSTPDRPTHSSTLDPSVQEYCQIIKDKFKIYKNESEWPVLRCGEQYFGRLSLVDRNAQNNKQWSITRGDNDIISQVHSKIKIEDVLKPNDSDQSLTVVVDGPPGIGKTTLCRKLLNLWANGELKHKQYDLVLYCPLRNIKIAQANKLEQILNYNYQCPNVSMVTEWLEKSHGKGLLIIFDGWDELNTQLRQSSLPTEIICKQLLHKCSVIVTSRSYASSSLLKLTSVNKHVQVMGFLEKEINTIIKGTLENNPQIAQELIDELKIRNDVYTLCYIPLICSIVIHVFEVNGQLPTTLTKLYENFILQAIRRYVANTGHYDPEDIQSLNEKHLPSNIATYFKEMCQFAYESLKENNPKMTFSSIEIQQHLKQTGYLGLIRNYDKDVYQFLHLSIQEFLAAWWIAKYNEKTEEIFNAHFDDDHFRMCLRFVAGLTQLKHEKNYQQYFNKELDLLCKRNPLFGFDVCYRSRFYQNPEIRLEAPDHVFTDDDDDNKFIACLQLLYESQNETLCEILSQSINNHSLCLYRVGLSVFDILCLSYFLNNSNITWNHLDLGLLDEQRVQILTNTLTNNSQHNQCKILQVHVYLVEVSMEQVIKLFQLSFFHNIQQCYITLHLYQQDLLYKLLLSLLQLHQLKILHLYLDLPDRSLSTTGQYSELTKCLEMNCTLQELAIERGPDRYLSIDMANDIVNGVANNKSITSFTLTSNPLYGTLYSTKLSDETIQHLLKNNHTLQALDIYNELSSSLNIVEVNTPLTAMRLNILHLPHIKGLQYLKLYQCHQPQLIFHSYSNLQQLDISLDTAESVNELFTILQSNTTLKALRVKIVNRDINSSIGNSLRDMLTLNKTIQCLEIDPPYHYRSFISSTYLSYLTTGLSYNNSLQELSVHIPLSHTNDQQLQTYFNVISRKYNLTELKVYFTLDQSYSNCSYKEKEQIMTPLYYEQGLPLVTNMLKLHTTIRLLHVQCNNIKYDLSQSQWIDSIKHLLQTIFLHPSLEYIRIERTQLLQDTFKVQKKTLIDKCKQQQLIKPLPIVDID